MPAINPVELGSVIKRQLAGFKDSREIEETGEVIYAGDGVARVYGLNNAMLNELLEFSGGVYGMALNLEEDCVSAVILGAGEGVREGSAVKLTGRVASVPCGEELAGRVVDALGRPLDGKGAVKGELMPVERHAPGVIERQPVNVPLQTGIKAIDALVPIGRGQRELIIGDRQTGKTALCIDTILNQKGRGVFCVYCAIGQKASTIASIVKTFEDTGAIRYTTVVAAPASDAPALQFIAPYAACSIAEEFMERGKDALVVYDDLSKHAAAYRSMSLLLRRPPGREAYPGDIFYIHSRLLERAARLSNERGGGSMTALPVVETQGGDISSYIPTNIISITDGQIYLEAELFNSGQKPAVSAGLSVSRVGGDAQTKALKKIAGALRIELAQYRELAAFSQFGAELDADALERIKRGDIITEALKQPQYKPLSAEYQTVVLYAAVKGFLSDVPARETGRFEAGLLDFMELRYKELLSEIRISGDLSQRLERRLAEAIELFKKKF